MLVGTGLRGGETSKDPNYAQYAASTDPSTGESGIDAFLYLFSLVPRKGRAFWEQRHLRKNDVDRPSLVCANWAVARGTNTRKRSDNCTSLT
jgi:hypothetical protein